MVDDIVLDCTDFKYKHPAGKSIIEGFGGCDCTWQVGVPVTYHPVEF